MHTTCSTKCLREKPSSIQAPFPWKGYLFFFLLTLLFSQSHSSPSLTSCLFHHKITNFTFLNHDQNVYNFSIQNLRFTIPGTRNPPVAIILPSKTSQVVAAIQCIRAQESLDIRVRSGGHSYEGISSVSSGETGFVIIDMMNMNLVGVDLGSETVWVEGGAIIGEVYCEIGEVSEGFGFVGGVSHSVGVSGQVSGGGIGVMSRKYGLAADNVVDAVIVDADGRVLDREGMGEDVFWAIRGGGGGTWGVVVAWRIKLVRVPPVVTSFIVSRGGGRDRIGDVVGKWQVVAPYLDDGFHLSVLVGAGFGESGNGKGEVSATFKGFFLGPRTEALSLIGQSFPELGIVEEECIESSWIESVLFFSGLGNGSRTSDLKNRNTNDRSYFKVKSDYVREPISDEGLGAMFDALEKEPRGFVILDPCGGALHRISGDSIAFPHREGNLFNIHYMVSWEDENNINSNGYLGWIRDFFDAMTPFVSSNPRTAHVNYIDLDLGVMNWSIAANFDIAVEEARVWGEKYFLSNYDRLVRAKTLIDPHNVFRHEQSIPPKSTVLEYNNPNDRTWDLFSESLGAKYPTEGIRQRELEGRLPLK